jgi:glycosyltransferase involved in cell wall biosynthesis
MYEAAANRLMTSSSADAGQSAGSPIPPRILAVLGGIVTIGGAEHMVFEALRFFRNSGSSVHCVFNDWDNEAAVTKARQIGATWSEGRYKHRLRFRNQSIRQTLVDALATFATSTDLLQKASDFHPDAILVADIETVLRNSVALGVLRARGIPVVLYLHNSPSRSSPHPQLLRWIVDAVVSRYAVISRFMERELVALGVDRDKISYVTNFVDDHADSASGDIARDPHKVFFAGQMIPHKGLDVLLDAFAIVLRQHPSAMLELATRTDGWIHPSFEDFRKRVLARADKSDLKSNVRWLGWRNDISALMSSAAVHCLISGTHEGMPLVCLEAKSAGTPSVVTGKGPFPELVSHKIDGWVCRDSSPESVAEGLLYFLRNPRLASAAGLEARRSASSFSRSSFERDWVSLFELVSR